MSSIRTSTGKEMIEHAREMVNYKHINQLINLLSALDVIKGATVAMPTAWVNVVTDHHGHSSLYEDGNLAINMGSKIEILDDDGGEE